MPFPHAKFSAFLAHRKQFIQIKDTELYKRARVQLHWKGIVLRDEVEGALIKTKDQQVARQGELLVAEIDAKVGGVGIVPPELGGAIVSSHYFLFEIDESKCLRPWLNWFIRSGGLADQFAARGSTNYAAIRPHHVLNCEMPLPPLNEQRHIVSRIAELAGKVDTAQALRHENTDAAQRLVGAEIQRLFTGPPAGWSSGHLGDYVLDACYGTSEKTTNDPSGIPILRMGNIQNGRLQTRDLKYLHIAPKQYPKLVLQKGDILVNRTNSAELVGKCAVFDLDAEFGFASYIIRLRLDTSRALSRLVASYINSPVGRAYMFNERKQMTGQANINLQKLRALPISLPSLFEQARLLGHLDELESRVEGLKKLQSETKAELDALMPSILSRAFRGEL